VTTNFTPLAQTLGARGAVFGVVLAAVVGAAIAVRSPARVIATPFSPPKTVLPARISPADLINVISEVGGTVTAVYLSPGSKVSAGQVIATLESPEAKNTLARAEARLSLLQQRPPGAALGIDPRTRRVLNEQLGSARSNLDLANQRLAQFSLDDYEKAHRESVRRRDEVERLLREKSLATKMELANADTRVEGASRDLNSQRQLLSRLQQERDAAASQLKIIQMQLETSKSGSKDDMAAAAAEGRTAVVFDLERKDAELALTAARRQVDGLTIRARAAGTVLAVKAKAGDFAWAGMPVATIGNLDQLALEAPLSAEVAISVPVGKPVNVRLPNDSTKVYRATVASVTLVPDQPQQAYLLRVVMPNPSSQVILAGLEGAIEIEHTGQGK
jgi:multidrug resistance efflux pump